MATGEIDRGSKSSVMWDCLSFGKKDFISSAAGSFSQILYGRVIRSYFLF